MEDFKASDVWFGAAVYNTGMLAFSTLEGDAGLMALNAGLIGLNTSLGLRGRKEEVKELSNDIRSMPERSLETIYESTVEENVRRDIEKNNLSEDYGSRRDRGLCGPESCLKAN